MYRNEGIHKLFCMNCPSVEVGFGDMTWNTEAEG